MAKKKMFLGGQTTDEEKKKKEKPKEAPKDKKSGKGTYTAPKQTFKRGGSTRRK